MIKRYNKILFFGLVLVSLWILSSCKNETEKEVSTSEVLFELKNNKSIGLEFSNTLVDSADFNVYKYRNYYNGGGVAVGDINNDGLQDVYMVSNQNENKLFLNKGNWKFEDITAKAGVAGTKVWSTGVTMVDINSDGNLDIYVCNSGGIKGESKENELFINKGDGTFVESAKAYGLNDEGFSTHASFFDYDKDGDLDCYVLNNSFQSIGSFNLKNNIRNVRDELGGDKLYQNNNGKFVDVSVKAGIYGSVIGFGLGITVGDVNNDGWEDIYISNDFFERDYLYINQKNGKFSEELTKQMKCTSAASMGADIADIDNDGYNDIFVTDMLPSSYERLKTVTTFDDWDRYMYGVDNNYYHQFTRNTLQHNNGNGTFSEIGRFSGVEASDWSWGALFFDMDNDGFKDLFIANGIYKDLTDQDYLQYISNQSVMENMIEADGVKYKELIDIIPSRPVKNQVYKNLGQNQFKPFTDSGLDMEGFSNGSAYADLDNDGDLDLIVNNVNMTSWVYENKASQIAKNTYLKFVLKGERSNKLAIGSRITVSDAMSGQKYCYENLPARGFESSMDNRPNIGLGSATIVDVEILWPSGTVTIQKGVKTNQILTFEEKDGAKVQLASPTIAKVQWVDKSKLFPYKHVENPFVDFYTDKLNYHMLSTTGPIVGHGDVNGDGTMDFVTPGPKGSATEIWSQGQDGHFSKIANPSLEKLKEGENVKTHLFDADGDKDLDLFVVSGGVEVDPFSIGLFDFLYLNDGKGQFTPTPQRFPEGNSGISSNAVATSDIDGDGDLDMFVGERIKTGDYGAPCSGYMYINNGKGIFTDETQKRAIGLQDFGMISDAIFEDIDGDKDADLIVVGEYVPLTIFENNQGKFEKIKLPAGINGWANVVKAIDIDNDGDKDLVVGNYGLNSRFRASETQPIGLFFRDFDENGMNDCVLASKHDNGQYYPYALRHNLMARLPGLKKKYPTFSSFKNASIDSIFSSDIIKSTTMLSADELSSYILVNDGKGKFKKKLLPLTVQYSPMYAIASMDINSDGYNDLIMGGNLYGVQPEMGRYDASYGHILINDKNGNFTDQSRQYGLSIDGQIRDIAVQGNSIYFFRNNDSPVCLQIKK